MKKKTPTPKRIGVPRPMLAMATPPNDRPMVTIDRLKGGEINWSLKTPASSVGAAITKALDEAARLIEGCLMLEDQERRYRAHLTQERAAKAAAQAAAQAEEDEDNGGNRKEGGK